MNRSRLFRWLSRGLPPMLLMALVVGYWQFHCVWFKVPHFLVPSPLRVAAAMTENSLYLARAAAVTGLAATAGFAISLVLGCLIAVLFSLSGVIRLSCYPYAIFLQTVPIVAIAPVVINIWGTGFQSVVIVATIISLFPIIANVTQGLVSVDKLLLDLFRVHRASVPQRLLKLQIPAAIPSLVTGARTSSGLAVVGAIVGEFFAGHGQDNPGLGYVIEVARQQLKTELLFATVAISTLLGVIVFATVSLVGHTILRRYSS